MNEDIQDVVLSVWKMTKHCAPCTYRTIHPQQGNFCGAIRVFGKVLRRRWDFLKLAPNGSNEFDVDLVLIPANHGDCVLETHSFLMRIPVGQIKAGDQFQLTAFFFKQPLR